MIVILKIVNTFFLFQILISLEFFNIYKFLNKLMFIIIYLQFLEKRKLKLYLQY
jgi:hypothetical protein